MNFISMFLYAFNPSQAGWIFMWAILVFAVFGLAIIIERTIYLTMRSSGKSEKFVKDVITLIQKDDLAGAQKLADQGSRTALGNVFKDALREAQAGAERIRNAVDEATLRIVPKLEKRTGYLGTIGNVSTLLGLMGTIYGLIVAFAAVGKPGIDPAEKSTLLAQGIAAAMNTTFLGLTVAVPSIAVYTFFKTKTQRIIDQIDEYSLRLVNMLVERSYRTHKYHISSSQLKEGVGVHVTHNNIKIFTDNKLIKEINI